MLSGCRMLHYLICTTVISKSEPYTWFEAQATCREKNQSLTLRNNESTVFYWTGFYRKISFWIKIIGCYSETAMQHGVMDIFQLSKPSPPLCQKHCYQKRVSVFAVQARKCICLSMSFDYTKNQLAASSCVYTCDEMDFLSTECGGESAFNVFLTDILNLSVTSRCLSLECGGSPMFREYQWSASLPTICSASAKRSDAETWNTGKQYCKDQGTYPKGNISLSNITQTCAETKGIGSAPHWVGVVKEMYQKEDQGQLITTAEQTSIKQCMKCLFDESSPLPDCQYVYCDLNLTTAVSCSKEEKTTQQPQDIDFNYSETTRRMFSTSMDGTTWNTSLDIKKITGSKESAIIVVPVVIVILLLALLACAILLYMYVRKRKNMQEKDKPRGRSTLTIGSTKYSNVQNHTDQNVVVLQQSNPSYELAGHISVASESPYTEAEDGTYDLLGNKEARKAHAEDIYNQASCNELSDLSDYDVANHKRLNAEDDTYGHSGVRDNSYGHFDLTQIKETVYSELS